MINLVPKCLVILFLSFSQESIRAESIILKPIMKGVNLYDGAIVWLGNPTLDLVDPCLEHAQCVPKNGEIVKLRNGTGDFVHGDQTLYLRQSVFNPSDQFQSYFVATEWSLVDRFYLLIDSKNHRSLRHTSRDINPQQRDYPSGKLTLKISIPPGESTLIMRLDNRGLYKGYVKIWDLQSFDERMRNERIIIWIIYGTLIALAMNLITIYLAAYKISAFFAALSIICLVICDLSYRGYDFELFSLLNIQYHDFRHTGIYLFGMLALAGLCKTMVLTLELERLNRKLARLFDFHMYSALVLIIPCVIFSFETATIIFGLTNIGLIPTLLKVGHWAYMTRALPRYSFAVTHLPYGVISSLFLAQLFGFLEPSFFYDLAAILGYCFLSLSTSMFFGGQYKIMLDEKIQALISQEAVKSSLEVAKVVQKNLLPNHPLHGFHTYEFYRPAEIVGGDSYYFTASDRFVFLSIFDVTGHGISSAIITGSISGAIKTVLKHELKNDTDPHEILRRITRSLNETILEYNSESKDHLVTMASVLIDTQKSLFYFANSGHVASYLITSQKIKTLFSTGSPLGLRVDPILTIKEYPLCGDDKILFVTDGILENLTIEGQIFKETEMMKRLKSMSHQSPVEIGHQFESLLNQLFDGQSLDDDMSFFLIGRDVA